MPKKILLADDSVTIQKVVELTFVDGDYQVTSVSNGKLAVQKLQQDRPDILLCDVIMPEMNGYDVAAFVKGNPAYSGIPVILLTGTFEPFDEDKAKASGADTTITKPFDSKMLVEKVEELIQRRMVFESTGPGESAQVFHSRQEFTLEAPPVSGTGPMPQLAPAEPSPFVAGEPEYLLPAEPAPSAIEDTATSSDASGPAPVAAGFFEPLDTESMPEPAQSETPEPHSPKGLPPGPFDGVDLGPITEADALSAVGRADAQGAAERRWELRLRVSNPTTNAVAVFWTDSYLVLPSGNHIPLVPLTLGSLPSSIAPGSSVETRFGFEADLASGGTVGVSLIWMGCCQAESAQWTWRLVRSQPAVDPASGPQVVRPETDGSPWAWGWILVGGILAVGLIAILLGL